MPKLTVNGIKALTKPGRYGDGGGLHLHVRDSGRRNWVLRYMLAGRSRDMGLGAYPEVTLAQARDLADAARRQIKAGADPLVRRHMPEPSGPPGVPTFRDAAARFIADKEGGWRNDKHRAQWSATLETYAHPVLGDLPVSDVTSELVMRVLRPIWGKVPETASRLRGRIEAVLDAAKVQGWREGENPARWRGQLALLLPTRRQTRATRHHPSLPWQEMSSFWAALTQRTGIAAEALRFAILTAARSGEVRGATWGEIDFAGAVWTIPAARMKAGARHRVPLSGPALGLLRRVAPETIKVDALVFPASRSGKPLSDMALTALLRRMNTEETPWLDPAFGAVITAHGFRSTFRVWAGETTECPRELVEAALAHTLRDKVEAAYARTDLLERRRALMRDWAAFCDASE